MTDNPILITGCARSGTSMTAGVINLCGAFGGKMSGATQNNQKGMFENNRIRNTITKPFLESIGADPMCQSPLPDIEKIWEMSETEAPKLRKRVLDVILEEGYKDGHWFYKGAKMCLLWPIWHLAFPSANWIIVRRDSKDIANSCLRTGFMRSYNTREGWQGWIDVHLERFAEMKLMGLSINEIWPQRMINGDFSEIEEVIRKLSLDWDSEKVMEFISPSLWNLGRKEKGAWQE